MHILNNAGNRKLNLLIVDDELVNRQRIRRLLGEAGLNAEIEESETASQAVQILSNKKFDIALLAYSLPDGNALTVMKDLRKYGRLHTPIVVMTADAHKKVADEVMQEGAQDYLSKEELNADNLDRAIRYSMQRHQLAHELSWSQEKERREKELRLLQNSVTESGASPSAVKNFPEILERFVKTYEKLLLQSLDESSFQTTQEARGLAQSLARELGDLRAGPKDVIDIHTAALKRALYKATKPKERAITEESRILLVQLMGFLVAHYREGKNDAPRMQRPSMDG